MFVGRLVEKKERRNEMVGDLVFAVTLIWFTISCYVLWWMGLFDFWSAIDVDRERCC